MPLAILATTCKIGTWQFKVYLKQKTFFTPMEWPVSVASPCPYLQTKLTKKKHWRLAVVAQPVMPAIGKLRQDWRLHSTKLLFKEIAVVLGVLILLTYSNKSQRIMREEGLIRRAWKQYLDWNCFHTNQVISGQTSNPRYLEHWGQRFINSEPGRAT